MKKIGFAVASMILVTLFIVTVAEAGWIEGKVTAVNQYPASTTIEITRSSDSAVFNKQVLANDNLNRIIALALSAQASDYTVKAYIDGSGKLSGLLVISP